MEQASARDCIIRGTVDLGGWGKGGKRGGRGRDGDKVWAKKEIEKVKERLDIVEARCYVVDN